MFKFSLFPKRENIPRQAGQAGVQAGHMAGPQPERPRPLSRPRPGAMAGHWPETAGLTAGQAGRPGRQTELACGTATTGGVCGNGESERGREDAGGLKTMGNSP